MYTDYETIYQTRVIDEFWVYFGLIVFLFILFLTLYGLSLMFKKASFKQVWAFIPFYNLYKLFEMCGIAKYNLIIMFIPVLNIYTFVKLAIEIGDCFNVKSKFKLMIFFLPFVAYPILGFSKIKYVGINNKKVNGIFIEELKKEEREEMSSSEIIKRDTTIGMGTSSFVRKDELNENKKLRADINILNQPNKIVDEYIECPNCRYKVKKGTSTCFMCGYKFNEQQPKD